MAAAPAPDAPGRWARTAAGPGVLLAVAAGALAFQLPVFDRWFSFMDEGHLLLFADIIAKGGHLYRDATLYPLPGAFYLLAVLFSIFEPSNLLARWVVVVEFTAFIAVCFVFLRRALPLHYALAGVLVLFVYRVWAFPHWHMYSYSSTALLIQMGALLVLLDALRRDAPRRVAAAGFLFGLGVLAKQDYGAAALVTFLSLLCLHAASTQRDSRPSLPALLLWFIAPASAVGAATGLYFAYHGILADVLRFTVFNHFAGISSYPYSTFPDLLPLFEQDPYTRGPGASAFIPGILLTSDWSRFAASALYRDTAVVDTSLKLYYYLPFFYALLAALRLFWIRAELRDPASRQSHLSEFSLWALGVTFLLLVTLNRPQDYVHLAVLYFPFLLLPLFHLRALLRGRRVLPWVLTALFLPPAGAALSYTTVLWWRLHTDHTAPIDSPRAGILVTPPQAALLDEILAYIRERTEPDDPVAVIPYFPLLSFYADRPGPHRSSYILWPFAEIPDRDQRVIEAMERTGTEVVIYNFTQFTVFNLVADYAPELYAYLIDRWEIERIFTTPGWGYKLAALHRRKEPPQRLLTADTPVALTLERDWSPPLPVEPGSRDRYTRLDSWPFRPTLALKPTRQGRTVLSLPLDVPGRARLRTAVAVHPKNWYHGDPPWADFELAVVDDGRRTTLFQRRLRPSAVQADRGWVEVEVPLDAWAGRRVMLEFSAGTNKESGESLLQAGWALPELIADDRAASRRDGADAG